MQKKLDDITLIAICLRLAGGYRALERKSGVSRQVVWRLQTGATKQLRNPVRNKLIIFAGATNGE